MRIEEDKQEERIAQGCLDDKKKGKQAQSSAQLALGECTSAQRAPWLLSA